MPPLLLPLVAVCAGVAPHLGKLGDHTVAAHKYWHDALGHMYLAWERFQGLTFQHGFFDFRWFHPYPNTGLYNEPAVTHGILFGLLDLLTPGEVWAFNLAMIIILCLNVLALYFLIDDYVHRPWVASIFATVGALSPFFWIRYAHPPNTVIFWGILGLLFLRRAARKPTWVRCIAAPLVFVAELFSSLYSGMFFLVPLVLFVPHALGTARRLGNLKLLFVRGGLVAIALLPLLFMLHAAYADTRSELGKVNSYRYVSRYESRSLGDLAPAVPLSCQLRALGVRKPQEQCREEMFPGRLVLFCAAAGLLIAGAASFRRFARRRYPARALAGPCLVAVGTATSFAIGYTLPFHLGLWAALLLPPRRGSPCPALRSALAVPLAAAILVTDVSVNPSITLFGRELTSIYWYFFLLVPGFDGLRSEYRIIAILPMFLALVGAVSVRRFLSFADRAAPIKVSTAALTVMGLWALLDAQPMWQQYEPMPRSDRPTPALAQAARLPANAVFGVVAGRHESIVKRNHLDATYWLGHIMQHRHRQIPGYSTYRAPASLALARVATTRRRSQRLRWALRLTYLFGGTHLIVDWRDRPVPTVRRVVRILEEIPGNPKLLTMDRRTAVIDVGTPPETAHGPVAGENHPGTNSVRIVAARSNHSRKPLGPALDGDPSNEWFGPFQRPGIWVELELDRTRCVAGLGFTPGLRTESIPTGFVIEAAEPAVAGGNRSFQTLTERSRWEVPAALVNKPLSGLLVIPFEETRTNRIRIRLTDGSPFRWMLARVEIYACKGG